MKIERARHEILTPFVGADELKRIERIARTCYKSEDKITEDLSSAIKLVGRLVKDGHEAMLEHGYLTVKFICDRAVSHELVRHRMASFAQESQRYCNYSQGRFGGDVTFLQPWWLDEDDMAWRIWRNACIDAEETYFKMLDLGYAPQNARLILPNCTKTEIVVTANWREWRHILQLRTAEDAHPDMRYLMGGLLAELKTKMPVLFDDIPTITPPAKEAV